ncbi:hypothetical protein GU926_18275 [Nibribacter ruber]|uniref:Carboxypeptidase-like regulatory domain-containing protein n=1 Tax=Nibribacter ruber TaxID=2698458 RepID=A0A6P1P4F6_9BACT|nr:carboxypeptidase-like regulatory domain-containing protein [Nibribacter ruber]QHL89273.1 hypothetical protein GU926_18275 [Nibribacter ruber]
MVKRLTIIIIIIASATTSWSQVIITGTVISKDDKSPLPGVAIIEKRSENGTSTKMDGTFSIEVSDPNSTLVFSFIGMRTKEVTLNGQRQILVETKWDCKKDFFDSQQIDIYASSGFINTPIGGKIGIASPWFLGGVIKGAYSYQTNAGGNVFQNAQVELAHYISNCDFDIDFRWSHRQVTLIDRLNSKANSFETDVNIGDIKLIAGYTHLNFNKAVDWDRSSGVLLGFGSYFNLPLHPTAIAKVSLYRDKIEYQASVQGGYKRFLCFLNFYKLNSFHEISLGIGTGLGYKVKKQKK